MKKIYTHILTACILAVGFSAQAQLYNYANDLGGVPATVAANATGTNLNRINGTEVTIGCIDGFNSFRFSKNATYNAYRPSIEFSITPDAMYEATVTAISANVRINLKGPSLWRMTYSTDGGATWTDNGSDLLVTSSGCDSVNILTWDLDDFTTTSTIWVRLVGFNAFSSVNGKATLRNVVVDGTIDAVDADGDGYTWLTDCNDADPDINPGATEICNEIDDNCDGNIDEGVTTTYYADADGDTYGDAAMMTEACTAPDGYVTDNTDCNDADGAINPGAVELCNGVDDNCDGNIDEGVLMTYYADADGDTYGDAAMTTEACVAPDGYVADNSDCNDADGAINPGATEICGNGIDENCDGNIDEDDVMASFDIIGDNPACANDGTYLQSTSTGVGITYQWYRNEMPIAGATDDTYTPLNNGYYQLEVSNGTCTSITPLTNLMIKQIPDAIAFAPYGTDICVLGIAKVKCISSPGTGATYQWFLDGVEIPGATNYVYETSTAGDYHVIVYGPNGCSNTSEPITLTADCKLDNGVQQGTIAVFPNPASGNFTVALQNAQLNGEALIQVSDITGRMIYTNNTIIANGALTQAIKLGDQIVNGMYVVTITSGNAAWNTRVVIAQ